MKKLQDSLKNLAVHQSIHLPENHHTLLQIVKKRLHQSIT